MRFVAPKYGGTKIVFDVGDTVVFHNLWAPTGFAYGVRLERLQAKERQWDGEQVIISRICENGTRLKVKHVIPPDPHAVIDCWRYVVGIVGTDNEEHDYLVNEIYIR